MSNHTKRIEQRLNEIALISDGGSERDAIRAVLDLHGTGTHCDVCADTDACEPLPHPCPTVQAIADEVGAVTDEP